MKGAVDDLSVLRYGKNVYPPQFQNHLGSLLPVLGSVILISLEHVEPADSHRAARTASRLNRFTELLPNSGCHKVNLHSSPYNEKYGDQVFH